MLCDDALREFVIDDDVTQPLKRVAYTSCCCVISQTDAEPNYCLVVAGCSDGRRP